MASAELDGLSKKEILDLVEEAKACVPSHAKAS